MPSCLNCVNVTNFYFSESEFILFQCPLFKNIIDKALKTDYFQEAVTNMQCEIDGMDINCILLYLKLPQNLAI